MVAMAHEDTSQSAVIRADVVRLLDRHRPRLLAYAFALCGDHHVAEDAVQELSLIVAARPDKVPAGDPDAGRWMRAVLRNKSLEMGRRSRKHRAELAGDVIEALAATFDEMDSEDAADRLQRMRLAMRDCVGQLKGDARCVIQMRYTEGKSCEQIAGRVGRSIQAVYAMLKRVRLALATCVDQKAARLEETA
jgi:RNA polymerase sigma-70 factor (ECF subfamily)